MDPSEIASYQSSLSSSGLFKIASLLRSNDTTRPSGESLLRISDVWPPPPNVASAYIPECELIKAETLSSSNTGVWYSDMVFLLDFRYVRQASYPSDGTPQS